MGGDGVSVSLQGDVEGFAGSHVVVEHCRGSNIYLLAPLKSVLESWHIF